ncbi:GtrA family protein [Streptomyces sp. AA4]|nr:GtrA family protein [Streptomyces sp. AA4]
MTTTRWKPRGRIGLRPRRKTSDSLVDDRFPESRTLDEPSDRRSPSSAEAADHGLPALADEIDPRRDPLDSDADLRVENARRHSAANPNEAGPPAKGTNLLPPKSAATAEASRQSRAATDLPAEPAHDQPAASLTTPPAHQSVADNRPDHREDRGTRRREMGGHAAWYLAAGVVTTGLQAVLFLAFRPEIGAQWANLAALAITTVGNTEFHRRVTFADRSGRAGKRHLQDLVTFAFYAGYGSVVLAALDALVETPSAGQQTAALLAASFVGGVVRFAVLRWWVFARTRRTDALQDHQQ